MPQSNELRVFISSTFRDMQEEREHLVKKIFPEIRALCRERGITFTEVDLRWGLTEEDAILGRIIRTCLEEVDKCRPYFIGMLGNRYGWIPELHELLMDPDLLAKYPWIEEVAIDGASVTEMEFIHGVFDAQEVASEYAFFYHRIGDSSEVDDPERLAALINRSRATGRPFHEFTSVEELGQLVHDDLVSLIDRYWPQSEVPTPLELERRTHSAFAASRLRAYIPNPLHWKEFTRWLDDGSTPLVVGGASGLGKSSLVAYLVEYYRRKKPTAIVIEHYVGASQSSGTATSVMQHVIEEIRERFGIDEAMPASAEQYVRSFPNWLFRSEYLVQQAGMEILIVIDAANQLDESGRRMSWLPATIPSGVKMMISTTPGETSDRLREREWQVLDVTPIHDENVRRSIVVRYLGEFHKGISPEQLRRVISDAKASSPLYLRVVAEELRLHGEHETLDTMIDRYVRAEDMLGLFEIVLERIEHDYGAAPVRDLLSSIEVSRGGLSETELLKITGMSRLELSRLLFAFDYHLIHRNGLIGFFHEFLQRAVAKRYLSHGERPDLMRRLVEYFQVVPESERSAGELLWLYRQLDDTEAVRALLGRLPMLEILRTSEEPYAALEAWKDLIERGVDPVETYRHGLAGLLLADQSPEGVAHAHGLAAQILVELGRRDAAQEIFEEALIYAEANDYLEGQARAVFGIGNLDLDRGRFDEALSRLQRSRQLHEQAGNHEASNAVLDELGILYTYRDGIGDVERAMECYLQRLTYYEQEGNRRQAAGLLHNIGVVCMNQGKFEEAINYFEQGMEINTNLGNLQWLILNLNALGEARAKQGEYGRALELHERSRMIAERLGDRNRVVTSIAHMGMANLESGDFDMALDYSTRARQLFIEMGDERKAMTVLGVIADILQRQGNYEGALDHSQQWLAISREQGTHSYVASALLLIGETLVNIVTYEADMPEYLPAYIPGMDTGNWRAMTLDRAGEHVDECVRFARQLDSESFLFAAGILQARIGYLRWTRGKPSATGSNNSLNMEAARDTLREMLDDSVDDEQKAELHYWLWKYEDDQESRDESLRLYGTLMQKTPRRHYRSRVDELSATVTPPEFFNAAE